MSSLITYLAPQLRIVPHPMDAHGKRTITTDSDSIILKVQARKYSAELKVSRPDEGTIIRTELKIVANSYLNYCMCIKDFGLKELEVILEVDVEEVDSIESLAVYLLKFGVVIVPDGMVFDEVEF